MGREEKKILRQPPSDPIKSIQYELFSNFVTNDKSAVSNAIEIWEAIPKYFFTAAQINKFRTTDGLAKPHKRNFMFDGKLCTVIIQPALIEDENGDYKAHFPSVTEELVEEVLKKIFTEQNYGIHNPEKVESWVKFSLSMIYKELKNKGKERNRSQIKHAIKVMSRCTLTILQENQEIYTGNILSDLITVNREEYVEDSSALHAARLPIFISQSINNLQYRQFNYYRFMLCDEQLSRWLYKLFINRFIQASIITEYHFKYSNVKQNSGLLQQKSDRDNRKKLASALDELKERNVLRDWIYKPVKEGRKVVDVVYTVYAGREFIGEQKAANKRASDQIPRRQPSDFR